jgi:hypothetical protein
LEAHPHEREYAEHREEDRVRNVPSRMRSADLKDAEQIKSGDDEKDDGEGESERLQEMTFASARQRQPVPKIKQYHPNGRKSCEWNQRVRNATDAYATNAATTPPTIA